MINNEGNVVINEATKLNYLSSLKSSLKEKKLISEENLKNLKIDDHFLDNIDVIGLDIDFTLSIYNMRGMIELVYDSFSKNLINKMNYPPEIGYENNKEFIMKMSQPELILDNLNGNIIKLDVNKKVIKAYHGKKELNNSEILNYYSDGKFPNYEPDIKSSDDYFQIISNFCISITPLYLLCVDLFDKGILKKKNYTEIRFDCFQTIIDNFAIVDELCDFTKIGYYFPEIAKNPPKYLYKYSYDYILKKLHDKGKKLFFATNSNHTYSEFIIKNTFGGDYKNYFDIGFWSAKKPNFFTDNEKNRCYFKDKTKIDIENLDDDTFNRIKNGENFIYEGSYKVVENYFKKLTGKKEIKCLFIGDDFLSDCFAPSKLNNWNAIYINDRFMNEEYIGDRPDEYGEGWKIDENYAEDKADFLSKCTLFSIPNIDALQYLC